MTKFGKTILSAGARLRSLLRWWPALAGILLFGLLCMAFLPYPGFQNDEVLFAQPLFAGGDTLYTGRLGGVRVPLMLLDYLGAWKTWVYAPILKHWPVSVDSIRLPVVLVCGLTLCIFFQLLHSLHGRRAAIAGVLLLATDSSFLLTGAFDWGPVAFQHFFLVAVLALGLFFHRTGRLWVLFAAAFCAGLGLWDKALFFWPLSGVCLASIALAPASWKPSRRKVLAAVLGFSLGALPLLYFNATHHLETFASNGHFTLAEFPGKFQVLKQTWNGSILFGYLINEESAANPRAPETTIERYSAALHNAAGTHRTNWMTPALLAALLLLPFFWRTAARRPMLFALIACAAAWFQMAVTRNAGGSAHHAVLLWPLPQAFVAVAIAQAGGARWKAGSWLSGALALLLLAGNLLNLNQCFFQLARYGAAGAWTDASRSLYVGVSKLPAGTPLMVADWGINSTLAVMGRGRLNLNVAIDPFKAMVPSNGDRQAARQFFARKDAAWVHFIDSREQFSGINGRLARMAAAEGYHKKVIMHIADSNGRPVFELFRLLR